MIKKIILGLALGCSMGTALADDILTFNFTGEVIPACRIENGGTTDVDFGTLKTGEIGLANFSIEFLCTTEINLIVYPMDETTYYYGSEVLSLTIHSGIHSGSGSPHEGSKLSQSNPQEHRGGAGNLSKSQLDFVVRVTGEGADKMNEWGTVNFGKVLTKTQNFSTSIPMVFEYN